MNRVVPRLFDTLHMYDFSMVFYILRPELKTRCSIVRELHVYGSVVPVNARDPTKFQHQGFGMLLMEEAERIAKEEHQSHKISVISGNNIDKFVCYSRF